MNLYKNNFFNLIFLIFITNTNFSQAHDLFNGGCKNHCKESFKKNNIEKRLKDINNENIFKDNFSCLRKSLCRG